MNRLLSVVTTLFLGCAKLPPDRDGIDESEADSADLSETAETDSGTGETVSGTGEDSGCEPGCVCHAPDWVCVPADSEVNIETLCSAWDRCPIICDAPFCDDVGGGACEAAHEQFSASASQICIDLLLTAETCHFGLTCAELLVSPCDPAHPCYQHWLAFRDAGCEISGAPNCE